MTWIVQTVRRFLIRCHFICSGPVIATGFVAPTGKKNHAPVIIPGWWAIRQCEMCGEPYSKRDDLLVPFLLPSDEVIREFQSMESSDDERAA